MNASHQEFSVGNFLSERSFSIFTFVAVSVSYGNTLAALPLKALHPIDIGSTGHHEI